MFKDYIKLVIKYCFWLSFKKCYGKKNVLGRDGIREKFYLNYIIKY